MPHIVSAIWDYIFWYTCYLYIIILTHSSSRLASYCRSLFATMNKTSNNCLCRSQRSVISRVLVFVCLLSVNRITRKALNRVSWNLVGVCSTVRRRLDKIWVDLSQDGGMAAIFSFCYNVINRIIGTIRWQQHTVAPSGECVWNKLIFHRPGWRQRRYVLYWALLVATCDVGGTWDKQSTKRRGLQNAQQILQGSRNQLLRYLLTKIKYTQTPTDRQTDTTEYMLSDTASGWQTL